MFDPATVRSLATYEEPRQFPEGIPYVFVNGVAVVDGGEHTGATPGRALRRGRSVVSAPRRLDTARRRIATLPELRRRRPRLTIETPARTPLAAPPAATRGVAVPTRREGPAKLTGTALYTDDLVFPGAWYGATIRSTDAHATLLAIELDPAFPWDRVVVVTADDIPGKNVVASIARGPADPRPASAARSGTRPSPSR